MTNYNGPSIARDILVLQGEDVNLNAKVGELQRYHTNGDFYVVVKDAISGRREIRITERTLGTASRLPERGGEFSEAVNRASALAPQYIEPPPVYQSRAEKRPGVLSRTGRRIGDLSSRVWNSKPIGDFKRAVVTWGLIGSFFGPAFYGAIKGYEHPHHTAINTDTRQLAQEITSSTSPDTDIGNYNLRIQQLEKAKQTLEDGIITNEDVKHFRGLCSGKFKQLEGWRDSEPVNQDDVYLEKLEGLTDNAERVLDLNMQNLKDLESFVQSSVSLADKYILTREELSALKSVVENTRDRTIRDASGIALNSALGSAIESTLNNYQNFMTGLKENGWYHSTLFTEIEKRIAVHPFDKYAGAPFIGFMFGLGAAEATAMGGLVIYALAKRKRKNKNNQTDNKPDEQEQAILHALEKPQPQKPRKRIYLEVNEK